MAPFLRGFRPFATAVPLAGPASPTLSATTQASALDLNRDGSHLVIVTRADLRNSIAAYEELLASTKAYKQALGVLGHATTVFAGSLDACGRLKGAGEAGETLMAAAGLQYMIANSVQVLSAALTRSFEEPLLAAFTTYVAQLQQRHAAYEALVAQRTAAIRQTEFENMKAGRQRNRDLSSFRRALEKLQEQVKEVEAVKRAYYQETWEEECANWGMISSKVAFLLRSTLELADRLASKANDTVLEKMLAAHPDPWDSYRAEDEEARDVMSVLPPLAMNGSHGLAGRRLETMPEASPSHASETTTPRQKALSVAEVLGLEVPPELLGSPLSNGSPHDMFSPAASASAPPSPVPHPSSPPPALDELPLPPPTLPLSFENVSTIAFVPDPPPLRASPPTLAVPETDPDGEPDDPMAGDWAPREYGQRLSPAPDHGYSSSE